MVLGDTQLTFLGCVYNYNQTPCLTVFCLLEATTVFGYLGSSLVLVSVIRIPGVTVANRAQTVGWQFHIASRCVSLTIWKLKIDPLDIVIVCQQSHLLLFCSILTLFVLKNAQVSRMFLPVGNNCLRHTLQLIYMRLWRFVLNVHSYILTNFKFMLYPNILYQNCSM